MLTQQTWNKAALSGREQTSSLRLQDGESVEYPNGDQTIRIVHSPAENSTESKMSEPFAAFPLAHTTDPDEAQAVLSRELSQLRFESVADRSRFRFTMNGCHLGRTMIAFNQFSTETVVDAGVVENAVIISLSVGPATVLDLDGEIVPPSRLAVVSPARSPTIYRSAGSGVLLLRTTIEAIQERLREWSGQELTSPVVFDRTANPAHGVGGQLHRFLTYVVDDARSVDTILNNPILRAGLDDMLLGAIASLGSNRADLFLEEFQAQNAPRLVRRAEEFMEAYAAEPITISDIVIECGCSRRTLFNAFRKHRGYTPMQFLAEFRLCSARTALQSPSPTDTVTSIAYAYGFSHPGRFAVAYRARFGEKPSETLRKPGCLSGQ